MQSAGERKHLPAAMRQMAVDSRHSLQSRRRRQKCRAIQRALIYSLAVSLSRLGCIDKRVITLVHAHSFIKRLQGALWGTCWHECQSLDRVGFSRTTTNKIHHITKHPEKVETFWLLTVILLALFRAATHSLMSATSLAWRKYRRETALMTERNRPRSRE